MNNKKNMFIKLILNSGFKDYHHIKDRNHMDPRGWILNIIFIYLRI